MDDSILDLWRHLLTGITFGLFLELLVQTSIFHSSRAAKVAWCAQKHKLRHSSGRKIANIKEK
jgi:hypothetical protein